MTKPTYDVFDYSDLCKECKSKLEDKYKYCCSTDRFYENEIYALRYNFSKLLEFIKSFNTPHSDNELKSIVKNMPSNTGSFVESFVILKIREFLKEIGQLQ